VTFRILSLGGAYCVDLSPLIDERGLFTRLLCMEELASIGHTKNVVQVNHSCTMRAGTVRGMHFQYPPKAEIKMVTCLRGRVFDVAIDLRQGSRSYLRWEGVVLSAENHRLMYIPEGCAHGFQTLEDNVELVYFHTEYYDPKLEEGVRYDDEAVGIAWPLKITEVSQRDLSHKRISETNFKGLII
jgi:dTDP-4-dehydrorhamnose 3,5-epimerase